MGILYGLIISLSEVNSLLSMIDKIDQVNRDARGVLTYAGLC